MKLPMKLRLQEALEDGFIWREKMERLGLVTMPTAKTVEAPRMGRPPIRDISDEERQRIAAMNAKASAKLAERRKQLMPDLVKVVAYHDQPWIKMKDVSKKMGINSQLCMEVARDCAAAGTITMVRYHEATRLAMIANQDKPLPEEPEWVKRKAEMKKANKLKQRDRERQADNKH